MKLLAALLLIGTLTIAGCTADSTEQQVRAVGTLDITGEYKVTPGKYIVHNWNGEELVLEFTLINRVQERCFTVNGDGQPICLQPGYSEVITWAYRGEDTSFTIKEAGQGNVQNELLCKIVGER